MTPQERQRVTNCSSAGHARNAPRDRDAERAIAEASRARRMPPMRWCRRRWCRTRRSSAPTPASASSKARPLRQPPRRADFSTPCARRMGSHAGSRGSVPTVRPGETPMGAPSGFRTRPRSRTSPIRRSLASRGGSFLGTAASAAAGVIGGALLLDGIRSMFGHGGAPFGAVDRAYGGDAHSPWGGRPAAPPTATSPARPASTTSATRRATTIRPPGHAALDCSTIPTMIPTTPIRASTRIRRRLRRRRRRHGLSASPPCVSRRDQRTTTLVPTLTRP